MGDGCQIFDVRYPRQVQRYNLLLFGHALRTHCHLV
jgi:hypothetical protein